MSEILLSILIPITPDRIYGVQPLLKKIGFCLGVNNFIDNGTWLKGWNNTATFETELWIYNDNKEATIGEKRDSLYKASNGKYSWQIDSDDDIADNAIELIIEAIKQNPDCITFEEHIDIDGVIQRSNHSLKYGDWNNNEDGFDYVRTPFMKSVIKTEIARSIPIPHIRFGEDHQWAQALKPHLKTEVHIPEQLYKYIHRSSSHNERYGII